MSKYVAIAIGGALGSLTRYCVATVINTRTNSRFQWGTFIVNMTACVLIGCVVTYLNRRHDLSATWRFLIPVGFIGAYSTFSTFEFEALTSIEAGAFALSSLYVAASVFLGLGCVWIGAQLARVLP